MAATKKNLEKSSKSKSDDRASATGDAKSGKKASATGSTKSKGGKKGGKASTSSK